MNFFIQYIIDNGLPQETVVFLLLLPIAATIIAFARQVVGIKGFGIYTPLIISLAFLATGLKIGLSFFAVIILVGTLVRFLVKSIALLYLPRMAIVLTCVAIAILLVFLIGAHFNYQGIINTSVFAVLIMISLVEKFIAAQIERGAKNAIVLTLETIVLSSICYLIISWSWLQTIVLDHPFWIILGAVVINLLLGRWTGLRLYEYYRFRDVIKRVELPKK